MCRPLGVKTVCRSRCTLRSSLVHVKQPREEKKKKGVIYEVPCKDCECVYIGETGRTVTLLTASDTPSYYLNESCLLSFVTAEEDLRIETSCPLNEATAMFMLRNLCYHLKSYILVHALHILKPFSKI